MKNISSLHNPLVKDYGKLRENSKLRRSTARFVVEGERELDRALRSGFICDTAFVCLSIAKPSTLKLLEQLDQQHIISVSEDVYKKMAVREGSGGVLGILQVREYSLESLTNVSSPLLLVLDSLEKPGNLGALARTADGVGADAIVVLDPNADVYNPNAVRASLGAIFSRPVVTPTFEQFVTYCQSRGVEIYTASPHAHEKYFACDLTGPVAIVLGSEALGLSEIWEAVPRKEVLIPMNGLADSLNVSVAGAVLLYEALRQRLTRC